MQVGIKFVFLNVIYIVMQKLQELKSHLKSGRLYKRAELEKWSKSVDRHLSQLLSMEILSKVGPGLYYAPKKNAFGI